MNRKRFFMIRHIALLLVILMLFGDVSVFSQSSENQAHFDKACKEYNDGRYDDAQNRLLRLVDFIKNEKTEFSARVHLLLGASIEQQGNPKEARKHYELSHALLEKPVIDGVDLTGLKQLEKSFSKKPRKWKNLDRDVIETPGVKKKKKFPVLLAVLGVAAVVAAVVLLGGGDTEKHTSNTPIYSSDPGRPDYSQEVFNSIKWVLVNGGKFSMGSNDGSADERPVHTVLSLIHI